MQTRGKRVINWFFYNVLFALVPLLSVFFFRLLYNKPIFEAGNDYPELLFFSLMLCATTLNDIRSEKDPKKWELPSVIMEGLLTFIIVSIAIMYGGLRYDNLINPNIQRPPTIYNGIFYMSIVVFIISIISQIILEVLPKKSETHQNVQV